VVETEDAIGHDYCYPVSFIVC